MATIGKGPMSDSPLPDSSQPDRPIPDRTRLPRVEFIALMAMLSAIMAYAIDAMLPALPVIGAELAAGATQQAAMVIPAFVLGLGFATLAAGPLADAYGRKPVILGGLALYALGAVIGASATSLPMLLASRFLMGMGAAGPRTASTALIRDLFKGREMAQILSFVMMVFMIVPAVAPFIGTFIIAASGWRGVFWSFLVFGGLAGAWLWLRQPETLAPAARRPISVANLLSGAGEVLRTRVALSAMIAQGLVFACLFGTLSSVQPLFDQTFGRGDSFPAWFALISVGSAAASLTNALLVRRIGMERVILFTLTAQVILSGAMAILTWGGLWPDALRFPGFMIWITGVFATAGLTMGNLGAMAMERLGHLAGLAATVMLAFATIGGALTAVPLALAFDGTPGPLSLGVLVLAGLALAAVRLGRGAGPRPA
jgi:MFS transporter, DHA1 family, multidrug resistance protein